MKHEIVKVKYLSAVVIDGKVTELTLADYPIKIGRTVEIMRIDITKEVSAPLKDRFRLVNRRRQNFNFKHVKL